MNKEIGELTLNELFDICRSQNTHQCLYECPLDFICGRLIIDLGKKLKEEIEINNGNGLK